MALPAGAIAIGEAPFGALTAVVAGLAICGAVLVWWRREQRLGGHRKDLRSLYLLSEEIFTAKTPAEILRRLELRLPRIAPVAGVTMYLHNRGSAVLEPVASDDDGKRRPVSLDVATGMPGSGAAACCRNRMLLAADDAGRGPFLPSAENAGCRAALFVPMVAKGEVLGVLELAMSRRGDGFSIDRQAAAQHLANQVATAISVLEQQTIREQLFRSEKLAAAGQLISGMANELRGPIEMIQRRVRDLHSSGGRETAAELEAIEREVWRASELVSRVTSFARAEDGQPREVDLNALLARLIEFRSQEWRVRGVIPELSLGPVRLAIAGAESHLDQAFLDLMLHAERCIAETGDRVIAVSTSLLANRAVVQIVFPAGAGGGVVDSVSVARGILMSHGGELREVAGRPGRIGFEVSLPAVSGVLSAPRKSDPADDALSGISLPRLTVLLVEPDANAGRDLVRRLAARNHRVVPVSNPEEGLDLIERLRFDIVFCAARLQSGNWIDFLERVRGRVGGFVLLSEGLDQDLAGTLTGQREWSLRKPAAEAELDAIFARLARGKAAG